MTHSDPTHFPLTPPPHLSWDEEVTTRSNCEELPPEYQPPDYPPLDFHTLFPESSDQQGDEEIQRKQMVADTGDIDIERHAPENDEESRKSTNKTWTTKVSRLNRVIKSTNYECYFLDIPDQFRFGEILARNRRIDVCYIRNCWNCERRVILTSDK